MTAIVDGDFAAVHQVGILRVGRGHAVLFDAHGMPVMEGDFAIHAAALHAGRAGILLAAAEAIGEGVVGGHVVHGGGGLGVPVAPRFAAIGGNHPALVADQQNDVGIVGIDPALLIIVAAGRAAHGGPGDAAILGAPEDRGAAIDHVVVLGVDRDGGQVAAADASQRPRIGRALRTGVSASVPVLAAIGRFIEARRLRPHRRVHRVRRRCQRGATAGRRCRAAPAAMA